MISVAGIKLHRILRPEISDETQLNTRSPQKLTPSGLFMGLSSTIIYTSDVYPTLPLLQLERLMLHSVYLSARLSLPVTLVTFELTIFLLFFIAILLLNYFYSCKKVGGGGGARAPQPLPLRGP